jgi:hypothetical protein
LAIDLANDYIISSSFPTISITVGNLSYGVNVANDNVSVPINS